MAKKHFSIFFFLLSTLVVFPQDSLLTLKAQKGEGIYAMLRKHGVNPYEYFDEFVELNAENLRDSLHLYEGKVYKLPKSKGLIDNSIPDSEPETNTAVKTVTHKIFGEQYKETAIKSERLAGTVYYLISGHGGPDPGTVTSYAGTLIAEDEYAYDITLRLAKELIAHSATVYVMVRDENDGIRDQRVLKVDHDEVMYPQQVIPLNQIDRLKQRTEAVNGLYMQHPNKYRRLIVTHVDSRSSGENIDVFFYHHKKSKASKKLAESIHSTFNEKYKKYQPNRDYRGSFSVRDLYMVNYTAPAMCYIEIGNILSEKDQRRILYPVNRQALAEWIAEGVLRDYEE